MERPNKSVRENRGFPEIDALLYLYPSDDYVLYPEVSHLCCTVARTSQWHSGISVYPSDDREPCSVMWHGNVPHWADGHRCQRGARDADVTQMGRRWDADGTQMGRRWDAGGRQVGR